jgi:hypothetical protein
MILATLACVLIVLFCVIYLAVWFATRNRPVKLGGRKTK